MNNCGHVGNRALHGTGYPARDSGSRIPRDGTGTRMMKCAGAGREWEQYGNLRDGSGMTWDKECGSGTEAGYKCVIPQCPAESRKSFPLVANFLFVIKYPWPLNSSETASNSPHSPLLYQDQYKQLTFDVMQPGSRFHTNYVITTKTVKYLILRMY